MIFRLAHAEARRRACAAIQQAPEGWVVRLTEPTRSLEQNAAMWAKLTDISAQVPWVVDYVDDTPVQGMLTPEEWKHVFSAAYKRLRRVPGIDGGFVVLGQSTSRMTKAEMSDLLELMTSFGAERGVKWSEPG